MTIRIHNTLTNKTEDFKPIKEGEVKMYHCGPTVYNYAHIGNLRAYIFADIIRRTFEWEGFKVRQVINITDVGHLTDDGDSGLDKMEESIKKEKKNASEIAEFYTKSFFDDLKKLNIKTENTVFPRATKHIQEDITLIEALISRGFTYETSSGIYFNTATFRDYGKLGNIDISGIEEGARIGIDKEKKNPTDFALWKFSPKEKSEKRQQEWDSPWGIGFPGWHIECSAMSMTYLGETFDIHTGGIDHIPVHHNNEIAQSECATGKPFVNYWMHNNFLTVDAKKMSKSLNNFVRMSTLIEKNFNPLAFKYWVLTAHYSTHLNFTWESMQNGENAFRKLKTFIGEIKEENGKINDKYLKTFKGYIENNFDTPQCIALIWKIIKDDKLSNADKKTTILEFDKVLGLDLKNNEYEIEEIPKELQNLIDEREEARKSSDWQKSDEIREKIKSMGFSIEDKEDGPKLSKI